MPNPYPVELRECAVRAYEAGGTYVSVAQQFAVSVSSLLRWVMRERETGSPAPFDKAGGRRSPVAWDVLEAVVQEKPDGTTEELRRLYNRRVSRAQRVHRSSVLRALRLRGYVFKKNARGPRKPTGPMSRPNEPRSSSGSPT
jgi:transposase